MYYTIRHKYAIVNSIIYYSIYIYKTWDVAQWCKSALDINARACTRACSLSRRSRVRIFLKVFFY